MWLFIKFQTRYVTRTLPHTCPSPKSVMNEIKLCMDGSLTTLLDGRWFTNVFAYQYNHSS